MTTTTISREAQLAVEYFERKLGFEIGPVELARSIEAKQPLQIIDLRTPELFTKGHVPTAKNVDFENLTKYAEQLNPSVTTVVYCYNLTCHLAAKAALELAKKGYKVRELVGGYDTYAVTGNKVEQGSVSCACG